MRFRLTYTASGRDVDLRRTWRGRRRAQRLADALLAAGYIARAKPDDAAPRMMVQAADREEQVRIVAYVARDGALVLGELVDTDMPQATLACLVRMLNVVEASTGWTTSGRAALDDQAAELSVLPDGTVAHEATLSESALEAAVGRLLAGLGPGDERARPGVDDALAAVRSSVAEAVPPGGGAFSVTWAFGLDGDFRLGWLVEGDDRSVLRACEPVAERGLERLQELGSDATGWPSGIGIVRRVVGADASDGAASDVAIEVDAYIDRIPVHPDGRPAEVWGDHVLAMARREPAHRPAWLAEALALMRRTGRRLPDSP